MCYTVVFSVVTQRSSLLTTTVNQYVSWSLSVKHAGKITFTQWKCRTFQSIIYSADEKTFIGTSSILAWGKSRVGLLSPFIVLMLNRFTLLRHFRDHLFNSGDFIEFHLSFKDSKISPKFVSSLSVFYTVRRSCELLVSWLAVYRMCNETVMWLK